MTSLEHVEEGYPLAPTPDGGDTKEMETSSVLSSHHAPSRRHAYASYNTRSILSKLRAKFHSLRPLVRATIILLAGLIPIYYLASVFLFREEYGFRGPSRPPPPRPPLEDEEFFDHSDDNPWPSPLPLPPPAPSNTSAEEWRRRAQEIKEAFAHAYGNYEKFAFPADELAPLTHGKIDPFNGWGVTAVDSLDTMLMMGFQEEYDRAVNHVAQLNFRNHNGTIPFFETSIRYLGGLLSAYSQTHDPILLQKADELAETLLPVFTSASGLPHYGVNPVMQAVAEWWGPDGVILAEMGSYQLEFKYLASLTGKRVYFEKAEKASRIMRQFQDNWSHMWSIFFNKKTGQPSSRHFSVGALADSAYEYILKQYLQTNKREKWLYDMYEQAMRGVFANLLYITYDRQLLFVTDVDGHPSAPSYTFEHLSCFLPGVLALGSHTLPLPQEQKQLHLWVAMGLANTCYLTYMDQASGLGPDEMSFVMRSKKWWPEYLLWKRDPSAVKTEPGYPPGVISDPKPEKDPKKREYFEKKNTYLLRPETIESLFILYRVTGDPAWRERGWDLWRNIQAKTRTDSGYASVAKVDEENPSILNSMPSYFLAETLKYLWLLFSEDNGQFDLDKIVFNTEAHPLPVFQWTPERIKEWRISA